MNYGNWGYGMMGGGGWGLWMSLAMVVWTIVGVLLIVWLWKQISKK